ncbi:MAG TPA: tRNA(His) guanylyltransferase Thg1 family protein [Kofleriaceae bacterium]|nr:tRNA(His) guanylyltransferase Thg1 family protein [Kofleriaceae bacterium]
MAKDGLGDRCKSFEAAEAGRRAMRGLPLLARLDGRAFHTFTRGLRRPYEHGLSVAMIETARYLVQEMIALVGYTQSDEITLAWYEPSQSASDYAFDGRFQKLASVLAGMASARFGKLIAEHLPGKASETPHFDCRVWQVPTLEDAADVFVWREDDATKNSITMAAGAHYADHELEGKNSSVKQEMLWQKGVNWNDFPTFFKRGTYLQRRTAARTLTEEERARIPEAHRPPLGATFQRTQVVELELPPVRQIANLGAVLFERAEPAART